MRLVTNVASDVFGALRAAADRMGGELRALALFESTDELVRWRPDGAVVFLYGWPDAAAETVDLLQGIGVPVAVWQVDDPHFFLDPKLHDVTIRAARTADVYFSHTRQLDEEYRAAGVEVHYLPTAAKLVPDAEELVRLPLPDDHCELDYSFVGTLTVPRRAFLERLASLLPPGFKGRMFTKASPLEALRIYRTTRVSLSFGTASDGEDLPSVALTERTWDVPLVGGFLLQDDRPYLAEHFVPGEESATYRDVEDCAKKLVHFREHPAERREIAARAQQRVLREHLMEQRLQVIVAGLRGRTTAARRRQRSQA